MALNVKQQSKNKGSKLHKEKRKQNGATIAVALSLKSNSLGHTATGNIILVSINEQYRLNSFSLSHYRC